VEAENTLSKVLEDRYILFDELVSGIRCYYENGWIQRAVLEGNVKQLNGVGVLPSRLHEK
jgi:hypothetical protein